MLNFRHYLKESLGASYVAKLEVREGGRYVLYEAIANDGRCISIEFFCLNPLKVIRRWELAFKVGDSFDITGDGDAFRIFATVLKTIENFYKLIEDDTIIVFFSASYIGDPKRKRAKLYRTLLNRFTKKYGFSFIEQDYGDGVTFFIQRNKHA